MADEPSFLNATASDPAANSYMTLTEADERMAEFEAFDAWDALEEDDQARMLIRGTRLIDQFHGWGTRFEEDQRLAFPRLIDVNGDIPDGVKRALLEYVDFRLKDEDGSLNGLKDLQAEGVTQQSMLGQSTSFEKDGSQLPAGVRKELERLASTHGHVENRPYHCGEGGDEAIFG